MKKLFSLIIATVLVCGIASAQYCGTSGPGVCIPSSAITMPGLYPLSDSLPPIIVGTNTNTTIQFKNFNTIFFSGTTLTIISLKIDTINNLPSGLCWATNKTTNQFNNQENGCINVTGTSCDTPGQYKLYIIVTANVGIPVQTNADAANLHYFVRLNNSCEATIPVDTNQTQANQFISYHVLPACPSQPLVLTLDSAVNACLGSTETIVPVISGGTCPYTYSWSSNGDHLSCTSCESPNFTVTQSSRLILTVVDADSLTVTDTVYYNAVGGSNNFNITAGGPTEFCSGGGVTFHASSQSGYSYQWKHDSTTIAGATDSVYTASHVTASGAYSCVFTVTAFGCVATSSAITVTVDAIPTVTLHITDTSFCPGSAQLVLNQGSPAGGTYKIDGVTAAGNFNPATATIGAHVISYKYSSGAGCTDSASKTVHVSLCTGIESVDAENMISVYPNPAHDLLTLESDLFNGNTVALVFDITGKAVKLGYTRLANKINFETQSLSPGAYFVKLSIGDKMITKRFMKD